MVSFVKDPVTGSYRIPILISVVELVISTLGNLTAVTTLLLISCPIFPRRDDEGSPVTVKRAAGLIGPVGPVTPV
jgi:hypothetical protein